MQLGMSPRLVPGGRRSRTNVQLPNESRRIRMPATPRAMIIPVTALQQNCTLIWDDATKVGAVVDPGGDLDRIEAAIRSQGVKVEKILLTHGHIDHAGGAAELKERLGVSGRGPHEADKFLLDSLPAASRELWPGAGPPDHARPLAERRRQPSPSAASASTSCSCRATRPQRGVREPRRAFSRWLVTWCSRARSAAPTCPAATTSN